MIQVMILIVGHAYGNTPENGKASVKLIIPDYFQSGTYQVQYIAMTDIALNRRNVYFSDYTGSLGDTGVKIDESPATIDIQTTNPDSTPPVLDLNQITVNAETNTS